MAAKTTSPKKMSPKKIKSSKADKAGKPDKNKSLKAAGEAELVAARTTIKKLNATVEKLQKNVAKLEKKAEGFKAEAKKLRATGVKEAKKTVQVAVERQTPVAEPEPALATEIVPVGDAPAAELTVAQLRAAAREQGVAGYSRMRKDQLIAALG